MKIDFENLGGIDEGSIELNDFTIFCGKNNSGKTYAMYSVYGLLAGVFNTNFTLDFVKPIVKKLKTDGNYCIDIAEIISKHKAEMIENILCDFNKNLSSLFGVSNDYFLNTKINVDLLLSDSELLEVIKMHKDFYNDQISFQGSTLKWQWNVNREEGKIYVELHNSEDRDGSLEYKISKHLIGAIFSAWLFSYDWFNRRAFLLPAERAGMSLFYKELFGVRNFLLQQSQNDNVDAMQLLDSVIRARYAEPIKDYLQFFNTIGMVTKDKEKGLYYDYAQKLQNDVLGGIYEVDEFSNISFVLSNDKGKLPLHFSSSTVKTLFGLVFYLEHLAKEGDYLMIDEPELNLHPDNQRLMARILVQLVNAGLKVVVSTHSDYFVRELNNLIMLKKHFPGAADLQKKYGYQDNELLASKQVSAYLFDDKKITPMVLDDEEGVIAETFDAVINDLNKSSNEIYYALQDTKDGN